ncbi:hypothetical protein FKM82_024722 [Ascaphus truei]
MSPPVSCPPEWDDDERMSFLFSAFKNTRDVNSSDWDSKMAFWVPMIIGHARANGLLSVTLHKLQGDFVRKGSIPLGLGTVIQEMIRQGALQRESAFVSSVTSGWLAWSLSQLVIRPLRWTLGAVQGGQICPEEVLVIPEVLKVHGDINYTVQHVHYQALEVYGDTWYHYTVKYVHNRGGSEKRYSA